MTPHDEPSRHALRQNLHALRGALTLTQEIMEELQELLADEPKAVATLEEFLVVTELSLWWCDRKLQRLKD